MLEDTNIKLGDVATDITCQSARAMLKALLAGQTDPVKLANLAKGKMRAKLAALEEALVNIFKYAYPEGAEEVEVVCGVEKDRLMIEVIDSGVPFDLTTLPDPDLVSDVDQRKIGGLGIFLIKKLVDDLRYRREGARNILSLVIQKGKR